MLIRRFSSPHVILGIPSRASESEAKKAYRSLVLKYHPDTNKDPKALEKFKEVTEAFRLWKNEHKETEDDEDPVFESHRPKFDGSISSVTRDDRKREYINFKPLDLEIPNKDRLGVTYKPFFDDKNATHPKTGTIMIITYGFSVSIIVSYYLWSLKDRDEKINQLLFEKLKKEYTSKDWDRDSLHPALEGMKESPLYMEYMKEKAEKESWSKFQALYETPSLPQTLRIEDYFEANRDFQPLPDF